MLKKIKNALSRKPEKTQLEKKPLAKKAGKKKENNKDDVLINRHQMIQEAAYFRAEKRNFFEGDPAKDWIAAEVEVDTLLSISKTSMG